MTPSRPYLIRALYEWILDIEDVPYLVVDATWPDVQAPMEYADNGRLILNVSPTAVQYLNVADELSFTARFGGVSQVVSVPMGAVLAIYGRDTGEGMGFGMEPGADLLEPQVTQDESESLTLSSNKEEDIAPNAEPKPSKRPTLRIVK